MAQISYENLLQMSGIAWLWHERPDDFGDFEEVDL
jgi:hypothetical protein